MSISLSFTDTNKGQVDMSVDNIVKVCKDVACANQASGTLSFPTPGFINFKI
jgi:hypothetical protein